MVNVSTAAPVGTNMAPNVAYVGMSPAAISSTPKASAAAKTNRSRGAPRRALTSAPASEPTASIVDSRANATASRWKTDLAISAVVI